MRKGPPIIALSLPEPRFFFIREKFLLRTMMLIKMDMGQKCCILMSDLSVYVVYRVFTVHELVQNAEYVTN